MDGKPGAGWGLDTNRGHGELPRCTSISWPPLRWPRCLSPEVPENQAPRDLPAGQRHSRATAGSRLGQRVHSPGRRGPGPSSPSNQLTEHSREFEASRQLGKVTGRPEDTAPELRLAQTQQSPNHSEFPAGSLGLARSPPSAGACGKGTKDSSPRTGPPCPRPRNTLQAGPAPSQGRRATWQIPPGSRYPPGTQPRGRKQRAPASSSSRAGQRPPVAR